MSEARWVILTEPENVKELFKDTVRRQKWHAHIIDLNTLTIEGESGRGDNRQFITGIGRRFIQFRDPKNPITEKNLRPGNIISYQNTDPGKPNRNASFPSKTGKIVHAFREVF